MNNAMPPTRLLPGLIAAALMLSPALSQAQSPPTGASANQPATGPAAQIPLTSPDEEIGARLTNMFRSIDGLSGVRVVVRDGIVTLEGTTLNAEGRRQAVDIASRLAGVVAVENKLVAERSVSRRIDPLLQSATAMTSSMIGLIPLILVALLVFLGFWLLGRFITRSTRLISRLAPNAFIETLVEQIVRVVFILTGLIAAMSILGATALLGSVLGAAGVIGLAVGFAVRDTIENYIASVLLSIRQPFRPNDFVNIVGFEGRITRLNSRATILTTGDGNEVRIPNATVYKANIINYTHTPERRFDFEVGIGVGSDIRAALAIALEAARGVSGVLPKPDAAVVVDRIDAEAIVIKVLGWVDQTKSDFGKTRSEAIRAVKESFDASAVPLAEPIDTGRRLPANVGQAQSDKEAKHSAAALNEVKDTSADKTIERKVRSIRSGGEEDLLAQGAPRE